MDNVVHRLSIEFKKRSAPCRRKKELQFNSPREKKKRKEDRKIVRRKEVSAIQRIIFLRLCDKGKKEKETRGAVS